MVMNSDPKITAGQLLRVSSSNRNKSEGAERNGYKQCKLVECVMCYKILRINLDREEFGAQSVISI